MDLSEIENMILEILSEDPKMPPEDTGFKPQDAKALESLIAKTKPFIKPAQELGQILKLYKGLGLEKLPLKPLQADWEKYVKRGEVPNEKELKADYEEKKKKNDKWFAKYEKTLSDIENTKAAIVKTKEINNKLNPTVAKLNAQRDAAVKKVVKPATKEKYKQQFNVKIQQLKQQSKQATEKRNKQLIPALKALKKEYSEQYEEASIALAKKERTEYQQIGKKIENIPAVMKKVKAIEKLANKSKKVKKNGPFLAYKSIINQMSDSAARADILQEEEGEVSPAMKKLQADFKAFSGVLVQHLKTLRKNELKKDGTIPDYLFGWLDQIIPSLKETFQKASNAYESVKGAEPTAEPASPDKVGADDPKIEQIQDEVDEQLANEVEEKEQETGEELSDEQISKIASQITNNININIGANLTPQQQQQIAQNAVQDVAPEKEPKAPDTIDPPKSKTESLVEAFETFKDKFYCRIDPNADALERENQLKTCREQGVSITKNEQHEKIRALIAALEQIVDSESEEAGDSAAFVAEAKIKLKALQQDLEVFRTETKQIEGMINDVQKNAGNRLGNTFLKRATKKVKDLLETAATVYADLQQPERQEVSEMNEEKLSAGERVKKAYDFVIQDVQIVIDKIQDPVKGDYKSDMKILKKALKKLNKILKLFPKGKIGGKKTASKDKIYDEYKKLLNELEQGLKVIRTLKGKKVTPIVMKKASGTIRNFAKGLSDMFGLEMPPEFKKAAADPEDATATADDEETTDDAATDAEEPQAPDESVERAREKYGKKRFIRDMSDEDRESFLKFMALMMDIGVLNEGFIDKLLGRHINFKKIFGSNAISGKIESAIKKLDREDRQRVVAILKQKENVEAFANLVRSKVDKRSASNVGQIKAMFGRGKASFKKITKKYPDVTPEMYNALVIFHILTTGDKKLNENNPKSLAKTFGRKTVKFQNKFGQVYSNDKIIAALQIFKRHMKEPFRILIDFFENKPKELNFILKSIALGTRGKRIEFDPKDYRKLMNVGFHASTGDEEETDTGDEESEELEGGKSAVKQIGAWLKSRSDRTDAGNLKKIATWMNANKDQLKYVKEDKKFKINTVEFADFDDKLKINYGLAGKRIAFLLDRSGIAKEFAKRIHWNGKPLVSWFGRLRMEEELTEMLVPIIQQEMRGLNG